MLISLPCCRRFAVSPDTSFVQSRWKNVKRPVQEVIANCFRTYRRLVELDKKYVAYPTALARFAVKQVRAVRPSRRKESSQRCDV